MRPYEPGLCVVVGLLALALAIVGLWWTQRQEDREEDQDR